MSEGISHKASLSQVFTATVLKTDVAADGLLVTQDLLGSSNYKADKQEVPVMEEKRRWDKDSVSTANMVPGLDLRILHLTLQEKKIFFKV